MVVYDTCDDSNQDETYELYEPRVKGVQDGAYDLYEQREDRIERNHTNDRMVLFKNNKLVILSSLFGMFLLGALTGFSISFFICKTADSGK